MWVIFAKEVKGFFSSITGYLVLIVFLGMNSFFLWLVPGQMNIMEGGYASLDGLFGFAPWAFLFLVPAITMRMFAEEKRSGTLELLYVRPVSEVQIVLAKFLASWSLVLLSLIPTLIYFWSVSRLGSPVGNIDMGGTWGSYLGLFFLGGIYVAIGVFASSLTDNQIVAFVISVVLSFLLYQGFDFMGGLADSGAMNLLISKVGINHHYNSISRGVLDSRDVLYFFGVMLLFVLSTRLVLASKKDIPRYAVVLAVLFVVAIVSAKFFVRVDMTSEKRYTLASSTKDVLEDLEAPVYFRVYLAGDLPPEFVNFQVSIREMLDEFKAYAGENVQYDFVNVYDEQDAELRNNTIYDLYHRGLRITNVKMKDDEGGSMDKMIFPGAILNFQGAEYPVNLLKNNPALPHEVNLSNSIQALEYEFSKALHSLSVTDVPKIAFIEGHGELDSLQTYSIMNELKNHFQVDRGQINGNVDILRDYEALIIAQPMRPFSEADKFALDQYVMQGGKVLWFIDPVLTMADSLANGMTISLVNELNIEDLLFKYGFRVDYNIVSDLQCNYIPVQISVGVDGEDTEMRPWVYSPLFSASPEHPITRGLNYVLGQFVSSFDTLSGVENLSRSILLSSSSRSLKRNVPLRIMMEELARDPDPAMFSDEGLPVAGIAEGVFESFYKNYSVPKGVKSSSGGIIQESKPTSMLLVTDGDMIRNDVQVQGGRYVASVLGHDAYTQQTFGNLEFILNVVNYMTDDTGLMQLRSREFKLRLLDKAVTSDKNAVRKWKMINALLPIVMVLLVSVLFYFLRRKKYT